MTKHSPFLNGNLKTILTILSILIIIASLIGNYFVGNYRLNAMEKKVAINEIKLNKLQIELSSINTKLDFLVDQYKDKK